MSAVWLLMVRVSAMISLEPPISTPVAPVRVKAPSTFKVAPSVLWKVIWPSSETVPPETNWVSALRVKSSTTSIVPFCSRTVEPLFEPLGSSVFKSSNMFLAEVNKVPPLLTSTLAAVVSANLRVNAVSVRLRMVSAAIPLPSTKILEFASPAVRVKFFKESLVSIGERSVIESFVTVRDPLFKVRLLSLANVPCSTVMLPPSPTNISPLMEPDSPSPLVTSKVMSFFKVKDSLPEVSTVRFWVEAPEKP